MDDEGCLQREGGGGVRKLIQALSCAILCGMLVGCTVLPGLSGTGGRSGDTTGSAGAGSAADGAPSREEVQRRLAAPRFAYIAESDVKFEGTARTAFGVFAVVDSTTDKVTGEAQLGTNLSDVAVSPDGRYTYLTDSDEPVVHVVDTATNKEIRRIELPGVQPGPTGRDATTKYTYEQMEGCSSAIRCTPDGKWVLVLSKAGLQVIDTASGTVTRTFPELRSGETLAVSFDGKRAYAGVSDWHTREARPLLGWVDLALAGEGGELAMVDLETWKVAKRRPAGLLGGIAVRPDDTQVFYSDIAERSLHVVDPLTLEDVKVVQLRDAKGAQFTPNGVGILPDGSKAYVVCAWTVGGAPAAENFFCAVVKTDTWSVAKRIPLQAY
jgi:YVTN family beta-propeller protein